MSRTANQSQRRPENSPLDHRGELDHEVDANPERLIFLSDGVFAIAITLLVLDLRLPDLGHSPSSTQLAHAFWDLKSNLFAFILSFAVIGNYWNQHRQFFGRIAKIDTRIVQLNFCLLFCVAILPFPTSILAEYHPTFFAVALYASVLATIGVISTAIRFHALEMMGINRMPAWPILKSRGLLASMLSPGVFLLSILIAVFSPLAAEISWVLLAFTPLIGQRIVGDPRNVR